MAKINESLMKKWNDGETVHAVEYNNERDLIVKALNDTDRRVDSVEGDIRAPFSVITNMIADGAVTPSKVVKETITQFAYDKAETDQLIVDAMTDGIPQSVIDSIVLGATATVANHTANTDIHVTAAKQTGWDAKETPGGAQTKATQALNDAKTYVDAKPWQKHKVTTDDGRCIALASGTDLNNLFSNGQYNGNGLTNAPDANWYYIEVLNHTNGNTFCMQRATMLSGAAHATLYERVCQGGIWGAWSVEVFSSINWLSSEVALVKQSGVDAKQKVVNALNAKGQPAITGHNWDDLSWLIGQISTGFPITAGDKVVYTNPRTPNTFATTYQFMAGVTVPATGIYRLKFTLEQSDNYQFNNYWAQLHVNGVPYGAEINGNSHSGTIYARDLPVGAGQEIAIYLRVTDGNYYVLIRSIQLCINFTTTDR